MKKLFSIAAALLFGLSAMAVEPTLEHTDWVNGETNFENVFTTVSGVTLTTDATEWKGNLSGHNYICSGGGTDFSATWANYFQVAATNKIDSIAVFWAPNGSNNTNIAWCGWESGVTPNVEVGSAHGVTALYTATKSYSDAIWQTINLTSYNLTTVLMSRQIKKAKENGTVLANFGGNQTVNFLGIKVWVSGQAAVTHTVTYTLGTGTGTAPTQADVAEGRKFTVASFEGCTAPTGYEFEAWNDGTSTYAPGDQYTMGTTNVTLTAQYKAYVPKYTVSFYDGETKLSEETVEQGATATRPADPIKELNTFDGWYNGESAYNFSTPVTANLTLTAHFTEMGEASAIDFEQFVMENGKSADVKTYLNAHNFSYNLTTGDDLDSLASGKTKNNYQFLGLKMKHNGSYLVGKIPAGTRVELVLGQKNNVKVLVNGVEATAPRGGVEADSTAGHTNYDFAEAGVLKVLCTGTSTLVIKGIAFGEMPTISDDATLSSLTLNSEAISGFVANKTSYNVTLPAGTIELPVVAATAHNSAAVVSSISYSEIVNDKATASFTVTAEDGTTTNTYTIHFTIEPTLGFMLIKATPTGKTTANGEGSYLGSVAFNGQDNHKLGSNGHYVGFTLSASHTFNEAKWLVLDVTTASSVSKIWFYGGVGTDSICEMSITLNEGINYIQLPEAVTTGNHQSLYLYRVSSAFNPIVNSAAVYAEEGAIPTTLEEIATEKAVKFIENGQLYILKNGVRYNALGAVVE